MSSHQGFVELPKKLFGKGLNENERKRKGNDHFVSDQHNFKKSTFAAVSIENDIHNATQINSFDQRVVVNDTDNEIEPHRSNPLEIISLIEYDSFFLRKNTTNTQTIDSSIITTEGSPNSKFKSKTSISDGENISGCKVTMSPESHHVQQTETGPISVVAPPIRQKWTLEEDILLLEACNLYGKQWKRVANHMGSSKNRSQCQHRWSVYVGPQEEARRAAVQDPHWTAQSRKIKIGPWLDEEITLLKHLVETHRTSTKNNQQHGIGQLVGRTGSTINWVLVAQDLLRPYKECRNKWKNLTAPRGKKGSFTPEEDQAVVTRVAEWGNRGPGLWTSLERDIGRRGKSICRRWQNVLQHRLGAVGESEQTDEVAARRLSVEQGEMSTGWMDGLSNPQDEGDEEDDGDETLDVVINAVDAGRLGLEMGQTEGSAVSDERTFV